MQQLNKEGGQFHPQFHQTIGTFTDQRVEVGKTHKNGEKHDSLEIGKQDKSMCNKSTIYN